MLFCWQWTTGQVYYLYATIHMDSDLCIIDGCGIGLLFSTSLLAVGWHGMENVQMPRCWGGSLRPSKTDRMLYGNRRRSTIWSCRRQSILIAFCHAELRRLRIIPQVFRHVFRRSDDFCCVGLIFHCLVVPWNLLYFISKTCKYFGCCWRSIISRMLDVHYVDVPPVAKHSWWVYGFSRHQLVFELVLRRLINNQRVANEVDSMQ